MSTPQEAPSPSSGGATTLRRTLMKYGTRVQSISAYAFSGFLVLHLAAPVGAGLGLDADAIMLLTREYYQTPMLEPILVWGSLGAHIGSSILRRALIGIPKRPSLHAITGWILVPMTLAHAFTHRILPASRGISPSLLSYQFVSHALYDTPITSLAIYSTLVLSALYHGIAGARALLSGRKKAAKLYEGGLPSTGYAMLIGTIGLGLVNLMKEGPDVPVWLAKRYTEVWDAVYMR
jgi:succinate dehydrogenase/fumarate reductase cytochrome b subunit